MVDLRMTRARRTRTAAIAVTGGLTGLLLFTGIVDAQAGGTPTSGGVVQAVSTSPLVSVAVPPYRILDTRLGTGTGGVVGPVGAGGSIDVQIAGVGPVPANAVGVVLNLTANGATEPGYVTAWPTGEPRPTASVLNLTPGIDMPNMVTLALGDGKVSLFNFAGSVHLIADVAAYLIPDTAPASTTTPGPTHHTLQLSGMSWIASQASAGLNYDGCVRPGANNLFMDLALPGGAVVDAVRVTYLDPSITQQLEVRLEYVTYKGFEIQGDYQQSSTAGALPGYGTLALSGWRENNGPVQAVGSELRPYLIAFKNDAGGYSPYDVAVCGVEVAYTLPPES